MPKPSHCECLHCKELYVPDRRNWWHQKFCTKPACRRASKAQSQRQWLNKPENQNAFHGWANCERVRQWRARHPGYWKRPKKSAGTLQEVFPAQVLENKEPTKKTSLPLQEVFLAAQDPLVVGLIAHLIDSPLQEVVAETTRRLLQKGRNILDMPSSMNTKGKTDADQKTNPLRTTAPQGAGAVQLGGPAAGAPALRPAL